MSTWWPAWKSDSSGTNTAAKDLAILLNDRVGGLWRENSPLINSEGFGAEVVGYEISRTSCKCLEGTFRLQTWSWYWISGSNACRPSRPTFSSSVDLVTLLFGMTRSFILIISKNKNVIASPSLTLSRLPPRKEKFREMREENVTEANISLSTTSRKVISLHKPHLYDTHTLTQQNHRCLIPTLGLPTHNFQPWSIRGIGELNEMRTLQCHF